MLGLMRIESVVRDRILHRNLATQSVAQSLAGPQTLLGPLLHMACVESWDVIETQGNERKLTERRQERTHTLVPSELKFAGEALPQTLRRGLHPVQTYLLKGNIQARWNDLAALRPAPAPPAPSDACSVMGTYCDQLCRPRSAGWSARPWWWAK